MEIRNLITFQKICEVKSFSEAAANLGYSQSTVTMQIKQLETELGVRLFDRIGRKISITNEGERFLVYAREIITQSQNAIADLSSGGNPKGELKIGILESICTAHLPSILHKYHQKYPFVSTVIKMGTFDTLSHMLDSGQIDVLWIFDNKIKNPDWITSFTYESPIVLVSSIENPLAQMPSLTLSRLAKEPLILTETDCSYRIDYTSRLSNLGYTPNVFLEIGNTEIIKKFVQADLGISVLPRYTLTDELLSHSLSILPVEDYNTVMYGQLLHHKNKWLSPALKELINLVSSEVL